MVGRLNPQMETLQVWLDALLPACNLRTQEGEAEESKVLRHPELENKFQAGLSYMGPSFKKEK